MAAEVEESRREAYTGEKKNQLREGFGIYQYSNRFFKYEGEWKAGKKHGHGKLVMADGSFYEGEFCEGEIEGHGYRYWASSGDKYSGQFHEGELHGQGVMNYANGGVYEGEWYRNRRQGYGVYNTPENDVYQGYLYDNKRHGEGTQIYSNGDRYDGDWVQGQRQGHGKLKCKDGTVYHGQWRNDLFNGQGTMVHSSGMSYEGLWINGKPANMATKLVIKCESPLEMTQGVPFSIEIECQNDEGTHIEDEGREIHLMAGFRYVPPKEFSAVSSSSKEDTSTGLFDMIEDVEEKPLSTPFGYDIVSYPLTDQIPEELLLGIESRSNTMLSETAGQEEEAAETTEPGNVEQSEDTKDQPEDEKSADKTPAETAEKVEESTLAAEGTEEDPAAVKPAETPVLPGVSNKRTEQGRVVFPSLLLPAAPPMYRPFMVLEAMESKKSKTKANKKDEERGPSKIKKEKTVLGDERVARPGEYIIVAQDVTNPAFNDEKLKPAFLLVKVNAPKKVRKAGQRKDKGPSDECET